VDTAGGGSTGGSGGGMPGGPLVGGSGSGSGGRFGVGVGGLGMIIGSGGLVGGFGTPAHSDLPGLSIMSIPKRVKNRKCCSQQIWGPTKFLDPK